MLLFKNKIGPSKIHGIGLFADEFIPKNTVIWRFTSGFDQKFTKEQILNLPVEAQIYLYKYSWKSKKTGLYCLSSDNGKYFNHSDNPNALSHYTENENEVVTVTVRDIQPGEEITDNYSSFESDTDMDNILDEVCKKNELVDELDPRLKAKNT